MSETYHYPRILLAFVIFLSYKRGGGFIEVDIEITDASHQLKRRIQYCVHGESSIKDNLEECSLLLEEHDSNAAEGSYPAHASLCICLRQGVIARQSAYVATAARADQSVHFASPTARSQTDAESRTDIRALQHIYQQIGTKDAQSPISRIDLMDLRDPELHRLSLVPLPRPRADNFVSLFRTVAERRSQNSAIESWDRRLTYSNLDCASTAMATSLRSLGVMRGDTVMLALDWSSWTPVCVLAIFKASAAICFVDPHQATERLDWYVAKLKVRCILCDAGNHDRLAACSAKVVSAQGCSFKSPTPSLQAEQQEAFAADVAHVLFTSGSTGIPKAVLTSQQALTAGAEHQARALGMAEHTRVLAGGPMHFAGTVSKLLLSLAVGACLCVPERSQGIVEAANQLNTNFLLLLVGGAQRIEPMQLKTRHTVCLGAEIVPTSTAALWGRHHSLRLVYGASEMNGVFTGAAWEDANSSCDVGRSAAHRAWIVDPTDHNRILPPGWLGEVLVQSVALAHGYPDDQTATARAFPNQPMWYGMVAKPQVPTPTTLGEPCDLPVRWYKTGDLGRLDPTTLSLEVFGRMDPQQLTLPGGRIDVTALEEAAPAAAGVAGMIAVQLGVPQGEDVPRVFAFLASERDDGLRPEVRVAGSGVVQDALLRRALREAWAPEAVESAGPEYVVVLECLPRVHTGKVWRHLLREWVAMHTTEQLAPWRLYVENDGDRMRSTVCSCSK